MKTYTIKLSGYKFTTDNLWQFIFIYIDTFVRHVYKFRSHTNKPYIIDCGSHIGVSVLYFKKVYPNSKIIAFEPNPYTFKLLEKNIAQNDIKNVICVNALVSNRNGKHDFFVSQTNQTSWGDAGVTNAWNDIYSDKKISVRSVNLNSYLSTNVDLLKLDIEGMETEVLKSIKSNMNKINRIILEFHGSHSNKTNDPKIINRLLLDANFGIKTFELKFFVYWEKINKLKNYIPKKYPYWLMVYAHKRRD